jgi:hypothetical protein
MTKLIPAGKALVVGAVAVGALTLGTAGIAGAAAPGTSVSASSVTPAALARFNCANATKALTRIEKVEGRVSAGLPKLKAAEAKANQAGRTRRAARIEKRIKRLESTTFGTRLTKASAAIEAKCHVGAPTS